MSYIVQYNYYQMPLIFIIGIILQFKLICNLGSITINTNICFRPIFFNKYDFKSWTNSKVSSPFFFNSIPIFHYSNWANCFMDYILSFTFINLFSNLFFENGFPSFKSYFI